jgi:MHS family proline/betaine transporter-like MFS transporter
MTPDNINDDETTALLTNDININKQKQHTLQLSSQPSDIQPQDDLRSTLASVAGNIFEWYDFAIYGYFSDVIGTLFFPPPSNDSGDDGEIHRSLLSSFLVFSVAFLARPLGGVLLGYLGDRVRRKKALEISLFLMAFPTFFMGCLPTYARVGRWSVVGLVAVRWMQGLSVGGQQMSSLVFVLEGRERKVWGFYGSFSMMASCMGTLLGQIVGVSNRSSLRQMSFYFAQSGFLTQHS